MPAPAPIRVAVTGAAGQIGYSLIFRLAAGEAFGKNQPVIQTFGYQAIYDATNSTIMATRTP